MAKSQIAIKREERKQRDAELAKAQETAANSTDPKQLRQQAEKAIATNKVVAAAFAGIDEAHNSAPVAPIVPPKSQAPNHPVPISSAQTEGEQTKVFWYDADELTVNEEINGRDQEWLCETNQQFQEFVNRVRLDKRIMIPIGITHKEDGTPEVQYGTRRRKAASICGFKVPCIEVDPKDQASTAQLKLLAFFENTGVDLSDYEKACAVVSILSDYPMKTDDQLADDLFDKSPSWVSRQRSFAALDKQIIQVVKSPWSTLTERNTREIRELWGKNPKKTKAWQVILDKLLTEDEQVSLSKLKQLFFPELSKLKPVDLKAEDGTLMARLHASKTGSAGKYKRVLEIHEDFDPERLATFIKRLKPSLELKA